MLKITDVLGQSIKATYNDFGYRKTVSDPDRGNWSFEYNGYGELKSQTDARLKTTSLSYDRLGRVTSRSWNENSRSGSTVVAFVESTEYETFVGSSNYGTIKKVTRVGGTAGADYERWEREFSYNALARAKQSITTMQAGLSAAITLTTQTKFDRNFGRTKQLVYPASSVDQGAVSIYQAYNALGALVKEGFAADYVPTNPEDSPAIRRLNGVDGRGLLSSESYGVRGNGVVDWHSTNLYDSSGWLLAQCASAAGYLCSQEVPSDTTNQPLDQRYRFDVYGNLKTQWHNGQWLDAKGQAVTGARGKEIYSYDALQRLTSATRTPSSGTPLPAVTYGYDDIGGLKFKSDYSTTSTQAYQYTGGTHQVHTVALATGGSANYFYDENGNTKRRVENGIETTLQYDIANLPRRIVKNTTTADFYEAQGGRYLQRLVAGGVTRDTYSLEKTYEREVVAGGITVERYYLTSGSLLTIKSDGRKLNYLHTDRLGSPVTITEKLLSSDGKLGDATPSLVEHKGFDAFGKALDGQWGTSNLGMLNLSGQAMNTGKRNQRGFTGHEHLDEFALIHMNGRAYDFNLGRFYGVDPFIQFPSNSQSLNPYGYLMNNPLAGTDPTGYAIDDCPDGNCKMTEVTEIQVYKDSTTGEYYAEASDGKHIIEVKSIDVKDNGGNPRSFELSSAVLAEAVQNIDKKNVLNSLTSSATSFNGVSIQGRNEDQLRSKHFNNYTARLGKTADFLPVISDIKGFAEFIENPTALGFTAAAAGILPGLGDLTASFLRKADGIAEFAAIAQKSCCCFAEGTLIYSAAGLIPIESIAVGDYVWSRNDSTGETSLKPVTQLFYTPAKPLYALVTVNAFGLEERIKVTDNHPYWVIGKGWVDSIDLVPGMQIESFDRSVLTVRVMQSIGQSEVTYNFTVGDFHTYFVGEQKALVHNCGRPCPIDAGDLVSINNRYNSAGAYREVQTVIVNAEYQQNLTRQIASIIRDIAGGHLFKDGNKRTATEAAELMIQRSGADEAPANLIQSVARRTARGELKSIDQITDALRGDK